MISSKITLLRRKEGIPLSDEKLISKKELLERYGMSYGALYRWKRKGLIPEDWFIRKATVTGQETFFPEGLITERVELILNGKNELELDELARRLRGEEKESWVLTVGTAYGDRRFQMEDVKSIVLSRGETKLDVTGLVTGKVKEAEAWI
jgi:hypothetical protein